MGALDLLAPACALWVAARLPHDLDLAIKSRWRYTAVTGV
jgi:hypothetical protein